MQVRVQPDDRIARDGDDLVTVVGLTMIDAALGTTLLVPTPDGEIEIEVPPGVQPGDVRGPARKGDAASLGRTAR